MMGWDGCSIRGGLRELLNQGPKVLGLGSLFPEEASSLGSSTGGWETSGIRNTWMPWEPEAPYPTLSHKK